MDDALGSQEYANVLKTGHGTLKVMTAIDIATKSLVYELISSGLDDPTKGSKVSLERVIVRVYLVWVHLTSPRRQVGDVRRE